MVLVATRQHTTCPTANALRNIMGIMLTHMKETKKKEEIFET
jgi:hypothetical protein